MTVRARYRSSDQTSRLINDAKRRHRVVEDIEIEPFSPTLHPAPSHGFTCFGPPYPVARTVNANKRGWETRLSRAAGTLYLLGMIALLYLVFALLASGAR